VHARHLTLKGLKYVYAVNYYAIIMQQEPAWQQHDCNIQEGMKSAID